MNLPVHLNVGLLSSIDLNNIYYFHVKNKIGPFSLHCSQGLDQFHSLLQESIIFYTQALNKRLQSKSDQ